MPYKPNEREYRSMGGLFLPQEPEKQEENTLILRGTPIVFDTPTVLFEIDGVRYIEQIARGALDECDMSDFILNRNHGANDSTVFARTRNRTLQYLITSKGLEIEADLDGADERHRNLYRDIQKGLVDKMSFSFTESESAYNRDTHTRTITKIKKLYDVSAVDFPAYDGTSISARSFFEAEHQKEVEDLERNRRRKWLIAKTFL